MSASGSSATRFLIRLIATTIAVSAAIAIVPGVHFASGTDNLFLDALALALFLALINMSLKPILQVLSLPITVLSLGLFALVVNTAMLYLAAWCASTLLGVHLVIGSFGAAFLASIVISIATWLISSLID